MTVYCYSGDEAFLLESAAKQLKNKLVDPSAVSWAYQCLKKPSIGQLLEALGTVSFNLGGTPLIEIQSFSPLEGAVSDKASQKQLEELQELLQSFIEQAEESSTKHILFYQPKLDKKVKFAKWLCAQKQIKQEQFKKFNFWEEDKAAEAVVSFAKEKAITIDLKAAQLLVEQYGVGLQPLINEVNKLAIYTNGKSITVQDVATLSNHHENTFEMLSQWIHGKGRHGIYDILEEILLTQHPVQLFGVAQSYLDQIFKLRYFKTLGWSEQLIADTLKKHPYKVKKDLEAFQSVSFDRLKQLKEAILKLEWQAKTGQLKDRLALEVLMGL